MEQLEQRRLLSVDITGLPNWLDLGSKPMISAGSDSDPDNPASGAIEDVAIDPNDPARMFAGTVNGGIWRTTNGNLPFNGIDDDGVNGVDDSREQPDWEPLTDDFPSLAIGDIRFDPLDPTGNTLFAGTGSASSLGRSGGQAIGVFRTEDGGDTWEVFPVTPGSGEPQIRAILPTTFDDEPLTPGVQQVVLVGTSTNTGLYRSTDSGETYTTISGTNGLPLGAVTDIIVDPNDDSRYFAGVVGQGVFRSDDGGLNWTAVNTNLTNLANSTSIQLTAHPGGGTTVLHTLVSGCTTVSPCTGFAAAFTSNDGGDNWTALAAIPGGFNSSNANLYTGMASDQILADPADSQVVYIAKGFGGSPDMFRFNPAGGGSWVQIENGGAAGNTQPHVDHRDLQFTVDHLGNDVLVDTNDGGIYFIKDPQNADANRWTSLHGRGATGLGVTEYTNVAWDSTFDVVTGGSQDNGTTVQNGFLDPVWTSYRGADGGDVQVDTVNAGAGQVFRYSGTQNFGLQRHTFDSATNQPVGAVGLVPGGGLANFNSYFVPLYELNTVDPSRLVTGGGGSSPVYELLNAASAPNAAGATWQAVPVGAGFGNVNNNADAPFVYGGRRGGVDNPEVLVVGSGGGVFVRSTAGGTLTATPTPFPGGNVQGIALDPDDWQHFFVADGSGVWETTDAGDNWTNLTRNLPQVNTRLQSIAFVPTAADGAVVVGGNLGVSRLLLGTPNAQWTRFGADLPNALVNDLEYNPTDDVLTAGTFGRGAFSVLSASVSVQQRAAVNVCGDDDHVNQDDEIRLVRNEANPLLLDIFINNTTDMPDEQLALANFEQINVFGVGGNDNLIVESSNGLINLPTGIRYNGDGACPDREPGERGFDRGVDTLTLTQTDGPTITSDQLEVGALPGSGVSTIVDDQGNLDPTDDIIQTVWFEELEPIVDAVPAPVLTINGGTVGTILNEDNAINYETSDLFGPTWGKVTIDAFEPIHFTNKAMLVVDAENGSDEINLNNPQTPTGLNSITVAGDDPTASDRVIVNGTSARDTIEVDQFSEDGARVTGAQPVPVTVETAELLAIVGQGGNDPLQITSPAGEEATIALTPGATIDSGEIQIDSLLPLTFQNLGDQGEITLGEPDDPGDDTFIYNGTGKDDFFRVGRAGRVRLFVGGAAPSPAPPPPPGTAQIPVNASSIDTLVLHLLEGDDVVQFPDGGQPGSRQGLFPGGVTLRGGGPSGSDRLIVDGEDGVAEAMTVTPGATVGEGTLDINALSIDFIGIEQIELDAQDDDPDTLTIHDSPASDELLLRSGTIGDRIDGEFITPVEFSGFDAATVSLLDFGDDTLTLLPTDLVGANEFEVEADPGEVDQLVLVGTDERDIVTSDADTVTLNDVAINFTPGDLSHITIRALDGADNITLTDIAEPKTIDAGAGTDIVDLSAAVDATILGGAGDDVLIGSPADDVILGGPGNDFLLGLDGNDHLDGGEGNDLLIGGGGNDSVFGGDGSDILVWNPGDGDDLVEGGEGRDVLQFVGGADADEFDISADGARLRFERQPGNVVLDVAGVEQVDADVTITFSGTLEGAQEVPPVATAAQGSTFLVYDSATNTFDLDVFVQGIPKGDLAASHIHHAPPGANGPVIFGIGDGSTYAAQGGGLRRSVRDATFPAANIADLFAGDTYVNVHTPAHPPGEIRAQLTQVTATADLNGADDLTVFDLATTEVESVNLGLGNDDGGAEDTVAVHGRSTADDLHVTVESNPAADLPDIVSIEGLQYDVDISSAVADDVDRLTVLGNEGDDFIKANPGVEDTIAITLHGGGGDDFLSADATLIGGDGDDTLEGGDGADMIFGDDPADDTATGEDVIIASAGDDMIDGGPQFDTIVIRGSSDADMIDVRQTAADTLFYDVDAPAPDADLAATDTITSIEEAKVEARAGADTVRIAIADDLFDDPGASLRMNVVGGDDQASDRLGVIDADTADLSILRQAQDSTQGTVEVGPGNEEPFLHVFSGVETVQVLADTLAPSGAPTNVENAAVANRLAVFKHDPFELNNDRNNSTHLGANETVNLDPTIDPGPGAFDLPADRDWYRVEAEVSGTIDFQVLFEQVAAVGGRPGLPGDGDLNVNIFDSDGDAIANFTTSDDDDDNERVRIPAVQGEIYFFEVFGDGEAINAYDVTVINLPALTPYDLELDDQPVGDDTLADAPNNSDTGRSHHDDITRDNTPTIVFRLDDNFFLNDLPGNDTPGMPLGDEPIEIPFRAGPAQPDEPGYAIAIFDEGDTPGGPAVEEPQTPLGFATMVEAGVYEFTTPTLADGSHFITARVQMLDPADPLQTGFGPRSQSLEIVVDTVDPPVFFGDTAVADDGLHPDSDSGVAGGLGNELTLDDRITNDETPTFWGRAEADSFIRVYVDVNDNGAVNPGTDVLIGQTTAEPLDGNNQFPDGQWQLTSTVNMNDQELLADLVANGVIDADEIDGRRPILVIAEDVPGNVSEPQSLEIFIDTQGPQVFDPDGDAVDDRHAVEIVGEEDFNLFNPKPTEGPSPLVNQLRINIRDLPDRIAAFAYDALQENAAGDPAEDPGNYRLVGDANGTIPIENVEFNALDSDGPGPATGEIILTFGEPLPDDRFTLTISDDVVDPAGNALDGEVNAPEPQDPPEFPTGDGTPGGDFVARFTVDSRPELAAWAAGTIWVDTNGNFVFDQDNPDFTNRDITYAFGNGSDVPTDHLFASDDVFAGNFQPLRDPGPDGQLNTADDPPGPDGIVGTADDPPPPPADGFDKLAAYGNVGLGADGPWRWLIDTDNDGVPDINQVEPLAVNGLPVAGNFDGNAANGDEVGVFTGTEWYFDTDHDFRLNADSVVPSVIEGYPIVGDFDGDGLDDLATWTDDRFEFDLAFNGFGNLDATIDFGFIGVRERPVAADMDQDGIDDIGLWVPDRAGQTPEETAEWYFLVSNDPEGTKRAPGTVTTLDHPFEPAPFGSDLYALFGDEFAIPVLGNFDPPVTFEEGEIAPGGQTNDRDPRDVNGNGTVEANDVLMLVNLLIDNDGVVQFEGVGEAVAAPYYDVNGDGYATTNDIIRVINYLNDPSSGEAEGEASLGARAARAAESATTEPLRVDATAANSMERAAGFAMTAADLQTTPSAADQNQRSESQRSDRQRDDRELPVPDTRRFSAQLRDLQAASDRLLGGNSAPETFAALALDDVISDIAEDISEAWLDESDQDRLLRQL